MLSGCSARPTSIARRSRMHSTLARCADSFTSLGGWKSCASALTRCFSNIAPTRADSFCSLSLFVPKGSRVSSLLHVLVLTDSVADADMLTYELRRAGFDLAMRRATTEAAYLAELAAPPDLI